jgi:8-oxo-dGTP diphosphatase
VTEFDIRIEAGGGGTATVYWNAASSTDRLIEAGLIEAVRAVADEALAGQGLRRLEVALPANDLAGRRAALRAGFRLEGVRRQALQAPDGSYGDVAIFARLAADQVHGPSGFSGVMNSALPRKRLIAHVLMRDADHRVLLCETQFKSDWELPGGIVEPYESPRRGAIREVREELGIDLEVGRLLVVDWMPPYLGWDDAIEMIFDGGTIDESDLAAWSLQPTEIRSVRLCSLDEAAGLVTPLAHRRLALAASLGPDQMAYTEDGRHLG